MCSNTAAQLARIGAAIDELAATALQGAGKSPPGQPGDITSRLAQIWAMVAELDPELARRVPGYGAWQGPCA